MRAFPAILVSLTLTATTLAGCGHSLGQAPTLRSGEMLQARGAQSATELASEFAKLLAPAYQGKLTVRGTTVTLKDGGAKTVYDFARTPETGDVKVTVGEFTTTIAHQKLLQGVESGKPNADVLPAMLVPIAIQVGTGGALGLANYWIKHRGDKFKKQEAVKATVEGMLAALVPITREVKYAQYLVPLAFALLKASKSFHYKDLAQAAMGMLDDIVQVIGAILRETNQALKGETKPAGV